MITKLFFLLLLWLLLFAQGYFLSMYMEGHNWVISGCLVFSGVAYILGFVEGVFRSEDQTRTL